MYADKKHYRSLLNDMCKGYCDPNRECILKNLLIHSQRFDPRLLVQLKSIDKFKFEQSELEKHDIGWDEAVRRWVELGYAEAFAVAYDPDLEIDTIYQRTIAIVKIEKSLTK